MVTNIPGNSIKDGVEVMQYVTPFSLEFTEAGEFVTDEAESSHPLIIAVFKQTAGRIVVDEAQKGCTKARSIQLTILGLIFYYPGDWTRRPQDSGLQGPRDQVRTGAGVRDLAADAVQRGRHPRHGLQAQPVCGRAVALSPAWHQ